LSVKKELSIGVLAVQGDIEENLVASRNALREMDVTGDATKVIYPEQIERVDGLILPGGESTVVSNLIKIQHGGIFQSIRKVISNGLPTLGTCAGMILLSKRAYDRVIGETRQQLLGTLDIEVERNAFGRQPDSFELDLDISLIGKVPFRGIFIRSPVVKKVGNDVNIFAKIDEKIVGVRQANILATSFHPELAGDTRLHREFINCILKHRQKGN
jgi:pyridoxal 5'-phosphate synthase pdxT subunit